ncbi:hypothetical protein EGR_05246 [Echinococcus granulosus]|uniref:Uncharacterized protein n=1 Tax=Echinococcus granulosus TaxID=6210 RepID=W6UEQ3_ECHGR|nr:hypothetical protein EGR_05246 [Echinococcus granulosus]EUB59920.1 hypothetical protein EGR_05246 [Echinococcus granulosus]
MGLQGPPAASQLKDNLKLDFGEDDEHLDKCHHDNAEDEDEAFKHLALPSLALYIPTHLRLHSLDREGFLEKASCTVVVRNSTNT